MANILIRWAQRLVQSQIRAVMQTELSYRPHTPIYPDIDQEKAVKDGYAGNSDVYSIISRKARMAAGIPFYAYRVKGKEGKRMLQKYRQLVGVPGMPLSIKSLLWSQIIKTKALEEVEEDHPLNILLQNPNEQTSAFEFFENAYGFLDTTGNAYIGKLRLEMGANAGKVRRLFTLPSQFMQIVPDGMFPLGVAGYVFYLYGRQPLEKEDVIHLKYSNLVHDTSGSQLYGMTPLMAAAKDLERSNSAVDSQVAQFQNGGPAGFVSNSAMDMTAENQEQIGLLKKRYDQEMNGNDNRGKLLFSAGDIKFTATGLSPVDLAILQAEMFTFRRLCRVYHMPSAIFNDNEHATMNNMEQFYKAAYTDGVIPMVIMMRDALNRALLPDFSQDGDLFIDPDYSGISVLQQDFKTLVEWLEKAWWISPEEKREVMKFAGTGDPNMSKIWMPKTLDTMENIAMGMDVADPGVDQLDQEGLNPYKQ